MIAMPFFGPRRSGWMFLVAAVVVCAQAYTCPSPCVPSECPALPSEGCPFGVTKESCLCCCVCAKGLNETCGGFQSVYGRCGRGLECHVDAPAGTPQSHLVQLPGKCRPNLENDEVYVECDNPTPTPTPSTPSPSPSPTPPLCPEPLDVESSECKEECSLDRCQNGNNKICSARGVTVLNTPKCRNSCLHTSCRACYFMVEPDCEITCPEPPTKRCLGKYYRCVQAFYFTTWESPTYSYWWNP